MADQFEYSITECTSKEDTFIVKLSGDLIGEHVVPDFMVQITNMIDSDRIKCIVKLSELRFINSSGIGILITLLTKMRNRGGELVLVKPSEKLNKLLAMTKLLAIFKITETEESAIELLN